LPVDARRGGGHGPPARAVPPLLARGAGMAARGLRGAGSREGRHPHADRPRRERVHAVRVPRDRRASRGRRPAAEHHQGRRHRRVPEDRRARPGRRRLPGPPLVLLRAGPRRDAPRGGHARGRHAGGVPDRRARGVAPRAADRRPGRLGRGAGRSRARRFPYAPGEARPLVLR
jgi:hypothetical protein